MKPLKIYLKAVALFLSLLMTIQSCTVYKSTSVTLEEAVQSGSKVKITTTSNKTFVYKKVVIDEGKYYGIDRIKSKKVKIPINQNLVKSINEKNQTLSTVLSVGFPIVILGGIAIINQAGGGLY